ncbi:hypothetical protein ANSO36C_18730 [Nostoc cf. commune SO-36]|uniref:Uncharacterized protein n=1 Tax=Nostoc cf. commune SO-36 TaxID=449208 RepID=A0ABN6PYE8_NOSCO|nr:hypothetical protein [Nostoc commune]BDI16071.1 hypothetical protein ANSO36C_18730 [Nostoc cf. commune SO-36]
MPSGHASHKSGSIKHTHDNGQIDTATDVTVDPQDILPEAVGYPFDAQGTVVNPAATERPQDSQDEHEKD